MSAAQFSVHNEDTWFGEWLNRDKLSSRVRSEDCL